MAELEALRHRPLLFVDDLYNPQLSDVDYHHFRRVLRIDHGAEITIGDGRGAWRTARFAAIPEATGAVHHAEVSPAPISVAFAPVKGTRAEWVVQKLTELGVERISLIETERSVVRWDAARRQKQMERLQGAAREACLQARRLGAPVIEETVSLSTFLEGRPEAVLADPGGGAPTATDTIIVVGPEGGFSPGELDGRRTVRLPGHILRAETAAVAAATMFTAIRAGLCQTRTL